MLKELCPYGGLSIPKLLATVGDPAVSPSQSLSEWNEKSIQKSICEREAGLVTNNSEHFLQSFGLRWERLTTSRQIR